MESLHAVRDEPDQHAEHRARAVMDWYDGGGTVWAWMVMGLCMVGCLGFAAWLLVTLARSGRAKAARAETIPAEPYARGEVDANEYQRRRSELAQH